MTSNRRSIRSLTTEFDPSKTSRNPSVEVKAKRLEFSNTVDRPDTPTLLTVQPSKDEKKASVPVVVDYFCGAGGFTSGALNAGAIVACGIDCDAGAQNTYTTNNHNPNGDEVPFILSRVEDLPPEDVKAYLDKYPGHPTIFVGCPPCQPFTNLRTSKESSSTSRNALLKFVTHAEQIRPDFVIVENVPGIRSPKYNGIWDKAVRRLNACGYNIRYEIVNAASYGVPQKRYRIILVASRRGNPPWPAVSHKSESYRTVKQALKSENLCRLKAGQKCKTDPLHAAAALSEINLRRIQAIRKPGGSRSSWPEELWLDCYRDHDGHTDVYGRMAWNRPAPTLTTRFVSLSNGRFGHPVEDRAITPREGALLQTFRADYQFLHPSRDMNVIHIGNAVPPALASAFVRAVIQALSSEVHCG